MLFKLICKNKIRGLVSCWPFFLQIEITTFNDARCSRKNTLINLQSMYKKQASFNVFFTSCTPQGKAVSNQFISISNLNGKVTNTEMTTLILLVHFIVTRLTTSIVL